MNGSRIGTGVAVLMLSAHVLVAQQPGQDQRGMRGDSAMAQRHIHVMDSLNAHLDTLVRRMNRARGNEKVTVMADVLNALVAERRMMQEHMRQMMGAGHGMMGDMKGKQPQRGNRRPPSPVDSSAADTGHAGHHPPP